MNYKESPIEKNTSVERKLIEKGLIPLDKSWVIRMGFLDVINGYGDNYTASFLNQQENLGNDLRVLGGALANWVTDEPIDVGESATLFRFLRFASWKLGLEKQFIKHGSLIERSITNDKKIIECSIPELLKLDNGTTQWASAAILMGNKERIPNPPYKLRLTQKALEHWNERRDMHEKWNGIYWDETILTHAVSFIHLIQNNSTDFVPKQAEDYCFARAFEFISPEEGARRWPNLRGHESNRIIEMEDALSQVYSGTKITSGDHRVVQAGVMRQIQLYGDINVKNPSSVNKSWPQFWKFLKG